jgi:putative flippase GtrA
VYALVGTANTVICYALFAALVHACGWHYRVALAADYAFGAVVGYALHRVSTFADRKHLRQAFGKYTATLAATFVGNYLLLDAIVRLRLVGPVPAQAAAMIVVTLAGYGVQKRWVFRSYPRGVPSRSTTARRAAHVAGAAERPRRDAA